MALKILRRSGLNQQTIIYHLTKNPTSLYVHPDKNAVPWNNRKEKQTLHNGIETSSEVSPEILIILTTKYNVCKVVVWQYWHNP